MPFVLQTKKIPTKKKPMALHVHQARSVGFNIPLIGAAVQSESDMSPNEQDDCVAAVHGA